MFYTWVILLRLQGELAVTYILCYEKVGCWMCFVYTFSRLFNCSRRRINEFDGWVINFFKLKINNKNLGSFFPSTQHFFKGLWLESFDNFFWRINVVFVLLMSFAVPLVGLMWVVFFNINGSKCGDFFLSILCKIIPK